MPDLNLDEIERRYEAATAGPWQAIKRSSNWVDIASSIGGTVAQAALWFWGNPGVPAENDANADFIAHARTDIPALVAEVKRLRKYADDCIDDIAGYEAAQVKLKNNALEEAAKICNGLKVAECLAQQDEDDDIWNDALDQAIEKIRALKTNKGE